MKELKTISAFKEAKTAKKEAERTYEEARENMLNELSTVLAEMPEGTKILNKTLAQQAGISPRAMANIIRSGRVYGHHYKDIQLTRVKKVTRYAEVDEDGQLVDNGCSKIVEQELLAYMKPETR